MAAPTAIVLAGLAWFSPVFFGRSYSPVPFYQNLVYPWRAIHSSLEGSWVQFDAAASGFPMWQYLRESLGRGDAPLWDKHSFVTGYPIAADGLSAYFYPPRLVLAALLEPGWAHDLFAVVNVVGGGLFAYLLFRRTTGLATPAAFGAVTWMFCAWTVAFQQFDMLAPAILLLPAALWAVDIAIHDRSWNWSILAGWVMSWTLAAGNIVDMLLVFWAAAFYAGGLTLATTRRRLKHPEGRAAVARLAIIGLVAACAAALVSIPTLANVGQAERLPMSWEMVRDGQTFPITLYAAWLAAPPRTPLDVVELSRMVWIGPVGFGLAALGFAIGPGRGSWFGRIGALVALAIASGGPLALVAYHTLPPFKNLASYARLNVIISFCLVALAVGAVAVLQRGIVLGAGRIRVRAGRSIAALTVVVLMIANTGLLLGYGLRLNPPFLDREDNPSFPPTGAGLALQAVLSQRTAWPGIVLPVAVTRSDHGWPGGALSGGTALVLGVGSAGGYDSLVPQRTADIVHLLAGKKSGSPVTQGLNPTFSSHKIPWDLVRRLGITHIFATPAPPAGVRENWGSLRRGRLVQIYDGSDGRIWRVPESQSGPYVARRSVSVATKREALEILAGDEWTDQTAVLEPGDLTTDATATGVADGEILSAGLGTNGATITARSSAPTWLIVPVSYDPGWTASVNGESVPVVPANVSRIGVPIPAGAAHVELRYRPAGLGIGLALTGGAAVISIAILGRSAFRPRRREAADGAA